MILFVDMEHKSGRSAPWGEMLLAGRMRIKYRIEEMTAQACHVAHYTNITPNFLSPFNFQAILLSGSATDPEHYTDLAGINQVILESPLPMIGLCGGWQFMAQAFGAEIAPMGALPAGTPPLTDKVIFREGMKQEFGFYPIQPKESHPLLDGLEGHPVFWHAHYMEVNPVPAGFRVIAETEWCATQLAVHQTLPRYGTQFHPEYYNDENNAGKILLQNFFKLAGVID